MYTLKNWQKFVKEILIRLKYLNVDVSKYQLDHIAYRTETTQEYESVKKEFAKLGELLPEIIIRDRRIALIKLVDPLIYGGFAIEALELLEPAADNKFKSGFEHAEFVVTEDLSDFMNKYPGIEWKTKALNRKNNPELGLSLGENMGVKFHNMPVLRVSEIQRETGVL